jgi:hypothetical protein
MVRDARKSALLTMTTKEIAMDLYFSPLACSMATRIAFYEASYDANYLEVDPATKRV